MTNQKLGNPVASSRIQIFPPRQQGRTVHWEGELRTAANATHRIYFEFSAPDDRPYPVSARPFLLAFLLPAMHAGAPLELAVPVDAVTLGNLMEWQEAMVNWHPQILRVVPIRAPRAVSPEMPFGAEALTAFSGGVDSNFTAWRQTRSSEPALFRKASLRAGLMIHGFDIPLEQSGKFEKAWAGSGEMLAAYGLKAYRLTTNLRSLDKLPGCNWETCSHGIWLAAALACYEPWFGHILIPSTYSYARLKLPWGSNPATDPLFSSATTVYWHDGAAYTKLTKVQAIAAEPMVQRHLRVCWQQVAMDGNCGRCFKCLATQVCFQLSGVERPEAFPQPCSSSRMARMKIKNNQNDLLIRSLRQEARRQGRGQMARALSRALLRGKIIRAFRQLKQAIRRRHP